MLTSNRDEAVGRVTIPPQIYTTNNTIIAYPKDSVAGGTWIGASDKKRVLCLLNGAFKKHTKKPNYRKSRGLVVKELLTCNNLEENIQAYNFSDIEPFTLICVDWSVTLQLTELVWDGIKAHITKLPLETKIWSSSTLYTDKMKALRKEWLATYLTENKQTSEVLLDFHEHYKVGDKNIDLQIDRGLLKTVSITQFEKMDNTIKNVYKDLLKQTMLSQEFNF